MAKKKKIVMIREDATVFIIAAGVLSLEVVEWCWKGLLECCGEKVFIEFLLSGCCRVVTAAVVRGLWNGCRT